MLAKSSAPVEQYDYYFNLLYSVYSLPNVLLPLVMGLAVDRYGCRVSIFVLACCVVCGHALFAAGVGMGSWPVMIAGRIVFGLGGESIQLAQNCLLFRWFKGKEVALALGLNLSLARSGSVLNDVLSPWAAERVGVVGACWLGTALCFISFIGNVYSIIEDKRRGDKVGITETISEEPVSLQEIVRMPRLFWSLATLCMVLYCVVMPFNNIASAFFVETSFAELPLAQAQQKAGNAMSIMFLVSALGTPPFGAMVDAIGLRAHFLLFSAVLAAFTYAVVWCLSPAAMCLSLGVIYTVFSGALWPTFALTVPQHQLGSAYGVATGMQNFGLAVVPLLVGHLQALAAPGDFRNVMRLFAAFGALGVVLAFDVFLEDSSGKAKGLLSLPSKMIRQDVEKPNEKTNLVDSNAKCML